MFQRGWRKCTADILVLADGVVRVEALGGGGVWNFELRTVVGASCSSTTIVRMVGFWSVSELPLLCRACEVFFESGEVLINIFWEGWLECEVDVIGFIVVVGWWLPDMS